MRWGVPRPRRRADSCALRALWERDVRASSWYWERAEVMRGVRARSERWRDRCGCCEGRLAMVFRGVGGFSLCVPFVVSFLYGLPLYPIPLLFFFSVWVWVWVGNAAN